MRLSELHLSGIPSTKPIYRSAGDKMMRMIYGPKVTFKRTVSGRYSQQPVYELSFENRNRD